MLNCTKTNMMNKLRPLILALAAALSALLVYGVFTLPQPQDAGELAVPALGLFNFSKIGLTITNVVVFLLFLLVFGLEGIRGRVKASKVFMCSAKLLGFAVLVLLSGELVAMVCGKVAGVAFKPFGIMNGIPYGNVVMIVTAAIAAGLTILVYVMARAKAVRASSGSMRASAALNAAKGHAFNTLYGALSLVFLLGVVFQIVTGENTVFFISLAAATLAMILYHMTNLRIWLLAGVVMILLHAFSFYHLLSLTLTIGAFGAVMMIAFLDLMVLIPLADLYMMPERKK